MTRGLPSIRKSETSDDKAHYDQPLHFFLMRCWSVSPARDRKLKDTSIHNLCVLSDLPPLSAWHIPRGRCLWRESCLWSMKRPLGRGSGHGGENELRRVGWRSHFNTSPCCKALLLGGIILPLARLFVQGQAGPGQPGRESMSGSGKKKNPEGSPVGTNWNRAQLQVRLHAFQMPPWNRSLRYLCERESITAPRPGPRSL